MGQQSTSSEVRVLREIPWVSIIIGGCGAFVLLIALGVMTLLFFEPPKNPPPTPWAPYVIPVIGLVLLIVGVVGCCCARVALRLKPLEFDLPHFNATIRWCDVASVDIAHRSAPLLIIYLTPTGRQAIGNRCLSNSVQVETILPPPDICLECNFISYGPDVETPLDLANHLRKQIASATGKGDARSLRPELDDPLELRDTFDTDPDERVYVHADCGSSTVISAGPFHWACNPLRYTAGQSICAKCGAVYLPSLRWRDTGATLTRFRKRMWRPTSPVVKFLQFVVAPALIGALAAVVVPKFFPLAKNISPTAGVAIMFGVGFLVGNMLILLTPLAGVIPALAGYVYHRYR